MQNDLIHMVPVQARPDGLHRAGQGGDGAGQKVLPAAVNVDHFYRRPTFHVVGLLTDKSEIPAISGDLAAAGVDVGAVEILCGEQGARILDADGRYHGLRGRVVRTVQRFGYDATTLDMFDEALRGGDLVLHVPARPADRRAIAALLQRH